MLGNFLKHEAKFLKEEITIRLLKSESLWYFAETETDSKENIGGGFLSLSFTKRARSEQSCPYGLGGVGSVLCFQSCWHKNGRYEIRLDTGDLAVIC